MQERRPSPFLVFFFPSPFHYGGSLPLSSGEAVTADGAVVNEDVFMAPMQGHQEAVRAPAGGTFRLEERHRPAHVNVRSKGDARNTVVRERHSRGKKSKSP